MRSPRDLTSRVSDLEGGTGPENLPAAGIIVLLSTAKAGGSLLWEDKERGIILVDGEPHKVTDNAVEKLDLAPSISRG
ncbi:hypothetical protein [Halalkalicoccus jeotgali]|uniref:Uncharacterized protein n=1 Tax=Halalkalicoccus jeotgali (strain DSM 18796 / CECT 7217 / JCM 14584 / KCTC 4019 / B3) TaxID=795797 RepID=L9VQT7_HALJB|nr:hypothetical protein [Halalkalicoccus jeotgali]ELY38608.1 hypothetical protein C497_06699 [Halalkalicoccus jeotgali B3]